MLLQMIWEFGFLTSSSQPLCFQRNKKATISIKRQFEAVPHAMHPSGNVI
jgi:hypothetical protein